MRKFFLLLALILLVQGMPLFAQFSPQEIPEFIESEFFYHTVTIEQIFIYRLGYVVIYRMPSSNHTAQVYIPHVWFTESSAPGEIIYLGRGREWPSMTVFYRDGQFSHVRLRLRRDKSHATWGVIPLNVNIDERFQNVERIQLEH